MSLVISRVHSPVLVLTGLMRGSSLRHLGRPSRLVCARVGAVTAVPSRGGHGVVTRCSLGLSAARSGSPELGFASWRCPPTWDPSWSN